MGRRKIEIKPIRDDRNRSVTFLKRKGGLFKKAHELSVLCSVDVAVIIFGHNKKLYEYSSTDIQEILGRYSYYGGPHEHKGPQDFADKRGGDDDDEDDEGGDEAEERGTPQPDYGRMLGNHPGFQNVRGGTPSGSPPIHNGMIPPFQRHPSPLPSGMSRPSSRAAHQPQHVRRQSANMNPQQPGPPPPQPNYAYTPNPPFYNPSAAASMQRPPPPPQAPAVNHAATYPPQYQPQPAPHHPQVQQAYMQDLRRSVPPGPSYTPPQPNMSRPTAHDHLQPPQASHQPLGSPQPQHQSRPTPSPQPPQQQFASPQPLQPRPLPAHAKASNFTPIDDSRSMLARNWGNMEPSSHAPFIKPEPDGPRSQSIDVANMHHHERHERANGTATPSPPTRPSAIRTPQIPNSRTASTTNLGPPSRSSTNQSEPKRPRLKVQIPSEQSGDEGGGSAPDSSSQIGTASHAQGQPSHVVLPPPSPSAVGPLLSAGAQGPVNPFARPAPPNHGGNRDMSNNHVEPSPISALPSRFMSDSLLPSPSTFLNDYMLPSPLNFQTPVVPNGGWREEDRKRGGEDLENGEPKKART